MISGVSERPWSAAARDALRSGVRVRKMARRRLLTASAFANRQVCVGRNAFLNVEINLFLEIFTVLHLFQSHAVITEGGHYIPNKPRLQKYNIPMNVDTALSLE